MCRVGERAHQPQHSTENLMENHKLNIHLRGGEVYARGAVKPLSERGKRQGSVSINTPPELISVKASVSACSCVSGTSS